MELLRQVLGVLGVTQPAVTPRERAMRARAALNEELNKPAGQRDEARLKSLRWRTLGFALPTAR